MTNVLNDSRGAQSLEMEVMRIREARAQANLLGIIEDNDPLEGTTSDTNLQSALKANLGRRHQAHDDGSRAKFHTTVHRLRFAVMIVFAVLVIGYLSLYVYTKVTFMHSGIGDISTLEHVLRSTQEITIRARKLELMEVFAVGHTGSSTLQAEIGDWARQMADYVIDVRVSKFALKPTVLEAWRSPTHRIATRAFTGVLADVGSRFTDLESIVSTFSAYSTYLAGQDLSSTLAAVAVPPTTFQPEATSFFSSHPQWAFIADEGLKNMVHNLEHLLETTTAAYNSLLRESQAFFTVCAIVARYDCEQLKSFLALNPRSSYILHPAPVSFRFYSRCFLSAHGCCARSWSAKR